MLKRATALIVVIVALLGCIACSTKMAPTATSTPTVAPKPTTISRATSPLTATSDPDSTPEPTSISPVQGISVTGPSCERDHFQENRIITKEVTIRANALLTVTVGSTPSIPCGWQAAEIDDDTVLRQVDHKDKWPAEGVEPKPGAPGTEIWVFQALDKGTCTVSLACTCLGEEGAEQEQVGTFVLNVSVGG